MKISAFIFSLYLTMLSFLPGMLSFICEGECTAMISCSEACEAPSEQEQNQDTEEKETTCPIGSCGINCLTFINKNHYSGIIVPPSPSPIIVQHEIIQDHTPTKGYFSECWNPPEKFTGDLI